MEKIIYPVWKKEGQGIKDFREQMLGSMSADLLSSGVLRLSIIVADDAVEGAATLRQQNINQPLMDANLKLLPRLLVDVRGTQNGIDRPFGRQRNRTTDFSTGALGRLDDFIRRTVQHGAFVCFQTNPDFLLSHAYLLLTR